MTAITNEHVKLRGEIVAWKTVRDGWGYGSLAPVGTGPAPTRKDTVKIIGTLIGVRVNDFVEITGVYQEGKYGRDLKVRECTVVRDESAQGAIKWMSSVLPGIGGARGGELIKLFGEKLWHVIEHEHARLAEVKGITLEGAERIHAAYELVKDKREHMVKLRGWGLTDNQINQCLVEWKTLEKVIAKLKENPYLLCQHVYGFGFLRADAIALKMGTPANAPERVKAGIEYALDEAITEGHCFVWGRKLQESAVKLLGINAQMVAQGIRLAMSSGRVVRCGARIYVRRMHSAERQLANGLAGLLGASGKEQAA
jgi:exodeoxyribonuclease V alpha subunit